MSDRLLIINKDAREAMRELPEGSVHCIVTSPPYWQLRDYGHAGQIGQEKTPDGYVAAMVDVMREAKRVLHKTGVVYLNVGDSTKDKNLCMIPFRLAIALQEDGWLVRSVIVWNKKACLPESVLDRPTNTWEPIFLLTKSLKYFWDAEAAKEPCTYDESMNERKARAKATHKGAPTSERNGICLPADAEEQVVMFDEPDIVLREDVNDIPLMLRNQRNVWTLGPEPFAGDHHAVYPSEIPRRAILAGTSLRGCCPDCHSPWVRDVVRTVVGELKEARYSGGGHQRADGTAGDNGGKGTTLGGQQDKVRRKTVDWKPTCKCGKEPVPCTVLDPFGGSGTTAMVAIELGRKAIIVDLNPKNISIIKQRTHVTAGLGI